MAEKIAICVGQNAYDPSTGISALRGCVNDALLIGEMLRKAGFRVRQVHDESATQREILLRLEVEIAKLREGDYFVFWNSSHGYQVRDRVGDELVDYLDEAICSYDTDPRDPLTDDKFVRIIGRAHPRAFVFFASDSCHSGTLTRATLENMTQDDRKPRLWIPPDDVLSRTGKPLIDLADYASGMAERSAPKRPVRHFGRLGREIPEQEMRHLLLSGCLAEQVSWDAKFPQAYHGAMTYHFARAVLGAWSNAQIITYRQAHQTACGGLKDSGFDQDPQLEGPDHLKDTPVFGYSP